MPKRVAQFVEFRLELARRDAVMVASGLPECDIVTSLDRARDPDDTDSMLRMSEQILAHAGACDP